MTKQEFIDGIMSIYKDNGQRRNRERALAELAACERKGLNVSTAIMLVKLHPEFDSVIMESHMPDGLMRFYANEKEWTEEEMRNVAASFYDAFSGESK